MCLRIYSLKRAVSFTSYSCFWSMCDLHILQRVNILMYSISIWEKPRVMQRFIEKANGLNDGQILV